MKKFLKMLTALCTAALAIIGGLVIYQKFFKKDGEFDEDFDEDFDDEELFEEDEEDDVSAFDNEDEIFEEEEPAPSKKPEETKGSETEDTDQETSGKKM